MPTPIQKLSFSLPSDTEIEFRRDFPAPRELVFEAMTQCEHMPQWMTGPDGWLMSICEADFRPGGAFVWGWTKAEGGDPMLITGRYVEIVHPERVVNTENWGEPWPEAINRLVLTENAGITSMTLTCTYASKEDRDNALKTGMSDGMSMSYDRLDQVLARKTQP